jgi:histone-arginine methyltransferase CARM1
MLNTRKQGQIGLQFDDKSGSKTFHDELSKRKADYERFEQYEQNSVQSYFQYYAKLGNQQNMLQDAVRTGTYRRSIVENPDDFQGKAVMDIGAGSGILSFFAAQTGASLVYAVEASSMAEVIRSLADANDFGSCTIEVVNKPLEAIGAEVPGQVDVLVSEPIGTFLFNERMIETYLCARDRFLKPGGTMFPNVGNLCIAPFSDTMLHWEQQNKNGFWKNTSFYGVDLTAALKRCTTEHFCQPIVDYINPDCLVSKCQTMRFDFTTITVESLQKIEIPFDFEISQPCLVHGIAGWFDALFEGSQSTVVLSTAPWCPGTHWYQIRFLLETPLAVNAGQHLEGYVRMEANNLQSYYVNVYMKIQGTEISSEAPRIDLKDPEYRFYTSPNAYCPPGTAGVWGQQQNQQQGGPPQVPPQTPPTQQPNAAPAQACQAVQSNGCTQARFQSPHVEGLAV